VNPLLGALVAAAVAVTVSVMPVVRHRAPEGRWLGDGGRISGVFGVLATGFSASAETEATLAAQDGRLGGWALYVKGGHLNFVYNVVGIQECTSTADAPVPQANTTCAWSSTTTAVTWRKAVTSRCSTTAQPSAPVDRRHPAVARPDRCGAKTHDGHLLSRNGSSTTATEPARRGARCGRTWHGGVHAPRPTTRRCQWPDCGGCDVFAVQHALGHSMPTITLDTCAATCGRRPGTAHGTPPPDLWRPCSPTEPKFCADSVRTRGTP
jgi:hypothetical protein